MQRSFRASTSNAPSQYFVNSVSRPLKAYHLRFHDPLAWTVARDIQNAIVKAYQAHHHLPKSFRRPLPPTFLTLRLKNVFTYGRRRDQRPSKEDRLLLEGLPRKDGLTAETRMAWERETGWRYHGVGQIHCWMVADLDHWKWQVSDVEAMMNSSLSSMLQYYFPSMWSFSSEQFLPGTPFFNALVSIEIHENKYKIVSYGCSLNVWEDQVIGARRFTRYGIEAPETTSLETREWENPEPDYMVQDRLVAEISRRAGVQPEDAELKFLERKFRTKILSKENAKDQPKRVDPKFFDEQYILNEIRIESTKSAGIESPGGLKEGLEPLRFDAAAFRKRIGEETDDGMVFVPSWGQYVRSARLARQSSKLSSTLQAFRPEPQDPPLRRGPEHANIDSMLPEISPIRSKNDQELGNLQLPDHKSSLPGSLATKGQPAGDPVVSLVFTDSPVKLEDSCDNVPVSATAVVMEESGELLKPPPGVLEQTIQWSTSTDFLFVPRLVHRRRTVVSPLKLRDYEYLGDLPEGKSIQKGNVSGMSTSSNSRAEAKLSDRTKVQLLLEEQKRIIQRMRNMIPRSKINVY